MSASRPDPWDWRELLRERIQLVAPAVQVPLAEAAGRLLAAELRSPEDVPALALSAMDGFAVRPARAMRCSCRSGTRCGS